jgi:CSLREA domain-containing protein
LPVAQAAGITVNTTTDEYGTGANCSLREAIRAANTDAAFGGCPAGSGADTIFLPAGTYTLTIAGANEDLNATGDLDITGTLTLNGAAMATTIINANAIDRALHVPTAGMTVTLLNLTVRNGRVTSDDGGGLYASGPALVSNTTFLSNTAFYGGGAVFFGPATVTGTTFLSNTAFYGGGAYFNGAATVTGTTFQGNTANRGGGAYFFGAATVTGTTFQGNTATTGGGGAYFNIITATVAGTTFSNNTVSNGSGGGARFFGAATVTGTTFVSNTAIGYGGGGAYFGFGGAATVAGTTFQGNTADWGGGAYFEGAATGDFVNTLFAANRAQANQGAGLYAANVAVNDVVTLRHVTIASPTVGSGSAVYVGGGTVNITNTIVASYSVGLERAGGSILRENYNLFSGVATPYSGNGTLASGGNSMTGTAAFAETTFYKLTSASAAIDAGTNAGVTTDFEGDPRPAGAGFDIGWDEADLPLSGLSAVNNSPKTVGTSVNFTATVITGTGITYQWNFGDGQFGSGPAVNHTYAAVGSYTATVTASNSVGSVNASTLVTVTQSGFKLYLPLITKQSGTSSVVAPNAPSSAALDIAREVWLSRRAWVAVV